MKKAILAFVILTPFIRLVGQVETYSAYPFLANTYSAFVIKISPETMRKFDIYQNDSMYRHQTFLKNLKTHDSTFFLINACISDTNCRPIGYFVKNTQIIQPANLKDGSGNFYLKPNGALLLSSDDAVICESGQINKYHGVILGIQSGPMLLINGSINRQFNQNSSNKKLRCGVGQFSNSKREKFLVFCISDNEVTFYDFASLFKVKFNCDNALCLESMGCTMYFPNQGIAKNLFDEIICTYLFYKL
jgi:uncharacterized protein YigE (DUF2233 family)